MVSSSTGTWPAHCPITSRMRARIAACLSMPPLNNTALGASSRSPGGACRRRKAPRWRVIAGSAAYGSPSSSNPARERRGTASSSGTRGRNPSSTSSSTSARPISALRTPPTRRAPLPGSTSRALCGAPSASSASLTSRAASCSSGQSRASSRGPRASSRGTARRAIATSTLSPPSSRCSETATRSSLNSSPACGSPRSTVTTVRSVVPPPTSTTSTREPGGSSSASRPACAPIQAYSAACGSSIRIGRSIPAACAASTVRLRATASKEAGTVMITSWRVKARAGSPSPMTASHASRMCSSSRLAACTGDSRGASSAPCQGRIGARRSTRSWLSQDLEEVTSRPLTRPPSRRASSPTTSSRRAPNGTLSPPAASSCGGGK